VRIPPLAVAIETALFVCGLVALAEDKRVEQPKGYHIVTKPARTGETPPEVKQEKMDEDNSRRRKPSYDIRDQAAPTREPELQPKEIKP